MRASLRNGRTLQAMTTTRVARVSRHPTLLTDAECTAVWDAIAGHGWSWLGAPGPQIAADRTGIELRRIESYIARCLALPSQWPELLSDADVSTIALYNGAAAVARIGVKAADRPPGLSVDEWIERETGIPAEAIRAYRAAAVVNRARALRVTGHSGVEELLECVRGQRRGQQHPR